MKLKVLSFREEGIGLSLKLEDESTGKRCEVQLSRREVGTAFMAHLPLLDGFVKELVTKINALEAA